MASRTTNDAVQGLRRRQQAEEAALTAVLGAAEVVQRVRQRRAAEVERLDAAVMQAETVEDEALAVLAALLPADVVAHLAGVGAARVRQAQQRAESEAVKGRVKELTGAAPARRRGRPRGLGRTRPVVGSDGASDAPDFGTGSGAAVVVPGGSEPTGDRAAARG